MRVYYCGHSAFLFSDENRSIVTDPFSGIGYQMERVKADYCLCSHKHYDHFNYAGVDINTVITAENASSFDWLKAVNSFHDDVLGKKRGKNTVFKFECGGLTICHMGDLGEKYNADLCGRIGRVDVLLIPVGGVCTVDSDEAYEYAREIAAPIVIPMHYKTHLSNLDIGGKELFLSHFSRVLKCPRSFDISRDVLIGGQCVLDLSDDSF